MYCTYVFKHLSYLENLSLVMFTEMVKKKKIIILYYEPLFIS